MKEKSRKIIDLEKQRRISQIFDINLKMVCRGKLYKICMCVEKEEKNKCPCIYENVLFSDPKRNKILLEKGIII